MGDVTLLCDKIPGIVQKYDRKLERFKPIIEKGFISLEVDEGDEEYNAFFTIYSQSQAILRVQITSDLQSVFKRASHSFMWTYVQDDEVHSLNFVFLNEDEELDFKRLFAVKMFEISTQESFEKQIQKADDRDWVYAAYGQAEEPDIQEDDIEMIDWDENASIHSDMHNLDDHEKNKHLEVS